MKTLKLVLLCGFLITTSVMFSQRGGHGGHRGHGRHYRSHYRPVKIIVFHPVWHPTYSCYRRWVYFPRYNFYWDNWRNHYVFLNSGIWVSQPTLPPALVNINLSSEKHTELKENDDDVDDVYQSNSQHQTEYKNQ